jgi:hypothetical protein
MESTRRGRDYQEDAAMAAAIAAVAVARDASTKADTVAAAIAAVAAASEAEAKDIEAAIFDFAASIDMDDEDVSKGVDEAVGNADVVIGAGVKINDGDNQGDGLIAPFSPLRKNRAWGTTIRRRATNGCHANCDNDRGGGGRNRQRPLQPQRRQRRRGQ